VKGGERINYLGEGRGMINSKRREGEGSILWGGSTTYQKSNFFKVSGEQQFI